MAPAAVSDQVYVRYQRMLPGQSWSALGSSPNRVGAGAVTVSGLTNLLGYVGILHAKVGALVSEVSGPQYFIPTDGSDSQIDLLMAAMAAQLNLLGLTSLDAEGESVAISAAVEIPPSFENVDTPCFKIFPDTEEAEALRAKNAIVPRVNVAFCQRSKTAGQKSEQFRIREIVRDEFLGKRPLAFTSALCTAETESEIMNMDALQNQMKWVSVVTFEFQGLRARR